MFKYRPFWVPKHTPPMVGPWTSSSLQKTGASIVFFAVYAWVQSKWWNQLPPPLTILFKTPSPSFWYQSNSLLHNSTRFFWCSVAHFLGTHLAWIFLNCIPCKQFYPQNRGWFQVYQQYRSLSLFYSLGSALQLFNISVCRRCPWTARVVLIQFVYCSVSE